MRVDVIKKNITPIAFYQRELGISPTTQQRAWTDGGLCPFHNDHRKGNFRINLETGSFTCFACGTKGGDIVSFIQRKRNKSFLEALKLLVKEWGIK
jgi:DNA primase